MGSTNLLRIANPPHSSDLHKRRKAQSQANAGEGKILYYQDPMHPWYHSDKPGIAPDCGMKLVPVYASDVSAGALPPGGIQISAARQQIMGVTSAKAEYRTIDQVVHTTGQVAVDESRISSVSTRVSGWVQKVFVNSTFQHVIVGEPLFTVYSPDLLEAEQEYLLALNARKMLGQSSLVGCQCGWSEPPGSGPHEAVLFGYRTRPDSRSRENRQAAARDHHLFTCQRPCSGAQGISQSIRHAGI